MVNCAAIITSSREAGNTRGWQSGGSWGAFPTTLPPSPWAAVSPSLQTNTGAPNSTAGTAPDTVPAPVGRERQTLKTYSTQQVVISTAEETHRVPCREHWLLTVGGVSPWSRSGSARGEVAFKWRAINYKGGGAGRSPETHKWTAACAGPPGAPRGCEMAP